MEEVNESKDIWLEVKDNRDVDNSKELIQESTSLVQHVSLAEFNILTFNFNMQLVIALSKFFFQGIINKRLKVQSWNPCDNLECHQVDNSKLYCRPEQKLKHV